METFEGKCDPQRLAKLEKRVGAADTPQESFHKSISIFCIFRKKNLKYRIFHPKIRNRIEIFEIAYFS